MEKNTKDVIRFWMTQAHKLTSSQSHKHTSSQAHKLTSSPTDRPTASPEVPMPAPATAGSCLCRCKPPILGTTGQKCQKRGGATIKGSVIPEEEVRGRWPRGPLGSSVGRLHKCGSSPEWRKLRVQTAAARQQPGSVVGAGALLGAGGPGGRCRGCAPWAGP